MDYERIVDYEIDVTEAIDKLNTFYEGLKKAETDEKRNEWYIWAKKNIISNLGYLFIIYIMDSAEETVYNYIDFKETQKERFSLGFRLLDEDIEKYREYYKKKREDIKRECIDSFKWFNELEKYVNAYIEFVQDFININSEEDYFNYIMKYIRSVYDEANVFDYAKLDIESSYFLAHPDKVLFKKLVENSTDLNNLKELDLKVEFKELHRIAEIDRETSPYNSALTYTNSTISKRI